MTDNLEQNFVDPRVLKPNPWNSNRVDPKNLAKLRKSIEEVGFTSAVVVRTMPDGSLQILGGQHRTEVAIDLGLKKIPILNVGSIDDHQAKKIGLVDNSRYGTDDSLKLAKLLEDLKVETPDLTGFLPLQDEDLQVIMRAVDINLDDLEVRPEDAHDEPTSPEERTERPAKTHDVLKFRVTMRDAEAIRALIEKTIKKESLDDGSDDMTIAGSALSILLLGDR